MVSLYDTLTRRVADVRPSDGRTLRMYSCGPTVYRTAHIGNLRTFLMADLARRAFEYRGMVVEQVQNITDVGHMTDELFDRGEDKMLVAAGLEGKTPAEIAEHYTGAFMRDTAAFNIERAKSYPKASENIDRMIELIARLIERGHAYERDGSVYYDVQSFPAYGALSGNTLEDLRPGHRTDDVDPAKKHHADFLLWKAAGPQRLIKFPSPWSDGYPGWHIECSAMSLAELGDEFDLHTGGVDLIFPHHEDEIAQSEGAVGHTVVRHWLHGEHLLAEGRKMSKSAGNFYDLSDLAGRGHSDPLALRLLFLQTRYRQQMNFTWDALDAAATSLERWRHAVAVAAREPAPGGEEARACEKRFVAALTEDLDTPGMLALVSEIASSKTLAPGDRAALLQRWDRVLGLDLAREVGAEEKIPPMVRDLIEQRERARSRQDWSTADRLRHKILSLGVEVEDTPEGPKARLRRR